MVRVVDLPKGQRPFRVHIDPRHDGAVKVFNLGDRIRTEFYWRMGWQIFSRPPIAREQTTSY